LRSSVPTARMVLPEQPGRPTCSPSSRTEALEVAAPRARAEPAVRPGRPPAAARGFRWVAAPEDWSEVARVRLAVRRVALWAASQEAPATTAAAGAALLVVSETAERACCFSRSDWPWRASRSAPLRGATLRRDARSCSATRGPEARGARVGGTQGCPQLWSLFAQLASRLPHRHRMFRPPELVTRGPRRVRNSSPALITTLAVLALPWLSACVVMTTGQAFLVPRRRKKAAPLFRRAPRLTWLQRLTQHHPRAQGP